MAELGVLGLAEQWMNTPAVKNRVNREGAVLMWCNEESIGIPSIACAALNPECLKCLIDIWCARNPLGSLSNGRVGPPLALLESEVLLK